MALSIAYALLASAIVLIVFLVVHRLRGLGFALVAGGLTCMGMFAMYAAMALLITSRM